MNRWLLVGLVIGLALLCGWTAQAQGPTDYWSFALTNYSGGSFADAGSAPTGVATPTAAPSFVTNAGGVSNGADSITYTNGINTTVSALNSGAGARSASR